MLRLTKFAENLIFGIYYKSLYYLTLLQSVCIMINKNCGDQNLYYPLFFIIKTDKCNLDYIFHYITTRKDLINFNLFHV